jgi:hypothetical protein
VYTPPYAGGAAVDALPARQHNTVALSSRLLLCRGFWTRGPCELVHQAKGDGSKEGDAVRLFNRGDVGTVMTGADTIARTPSHSVAAHKTYQQIIHWRPK